MLHNPFITKLHGVYMGPGDILLLVVDHYEEGCLADFINEHSLELQARKQFGTHKGVKNTSMIYRKGLPLDLIQKFFWHMIAGIAYLHYHRLVHRNIKCDNYMLKGTPKNQKLQLRDFRYATSLEDGEDLERRFGII